MAQHKKKCNPNETNEKRRLKANALTTQAEARGWTVKDPARADVCEIGGGALECCEEYKYLGSLLRSDGDPGADIKRRTDIGQATIKQLKNIWKSKDIPGELKGHLYTTLVNAVVLYNSETWTLGAAHWKILKQFHRRATRTVLGRQWLREEHGDSPTSEEYKKDEEEVAQLVRDVLKLKPIEESIAIRRRRWVDHHLRNPDELIEEEFERQREEGAKWWTDFETELVEDETSWGELETAWTEWREQTAHNKLAGISAKVSHPVIGKRANDAKNTEKENEQESENNNNNT